jgi:AcrR family transcriptional regulator
VQYYYGSKDGLVAAIFADRLGSLAERRSLLKSRVAPHDLRARFEAHILPLFELAESGSNFYISFVEELERSGAAQVFAGSKDVVQAQDEFLRDMQPLLAQVPEPVRSLRLHHVQSFSLHVAAERERAARRHAIAVPFGLFVETVVDGCTGYLVAPVGHEVRRMAKSLKKVDPGRAFLV